MQSHHNSSRYHRCFAAVDLSAIDHNLEQLTSLLHPGVKPLAVVKADAYGHGAAVVARHIEDRVYGFAVAAVDEAVELRQAGVKKPVLVLSYTSPLQYDRLLEHNVTATVYNADEAAALSRVALSRGQKVTVHVAVDTGMGRIGVPADETGADTVAAIAACPGLTVEGLFSHYACADCADKTASHRQTALFDAFIARLEARGIHIPLKHICNTAGAMELDNQYDLCRLGIALYGLYPSQEVVKTLTLRPALEVVAHVVQVKEIPAGFKVGYGHVYEAPSPRRIATVSVGYADGFNRCFSEGGSVLIGGHRAPVVGRVCMDLIMVDVTDVPSVAVDQHVIILGENEGARITAEELGALSHSCNYEVLCNYSPRVARIYYLDGKMVEK